MSDLRKQLWKRLLGSPWFWLPATVAVAAGVLGYIPISIAGGVLAVGGLVGRLAFGFDQLRKDAESVEAQKVLAERERQLDALAVDLRADRDFRTKDALTLARDAMREFEVQASKSDLKFQSREIGKQMQDLFQATIEQLELSLKLFEQADRLVGEDRKAILDSRDAIVTQITQSSRQLQLAAEQFRNMLQSNRDADIEPLREELETSLRVARRVDERMRELELPSSLPSRLEE